MITLEQFESQWLEEVVAGSHQPHNLVIGSRKKYFVIGTKLTQLLLRSSCATVRVTEVLTLQYLSPKTLARELKATLGY